MMTIRLRRLAAITAHDLRLLAKEPAIFALILVMPPILIVLIRPSLNATLASMNLEATGGALQAIPGAAVLFSMLVLSVTATASYREHAWNTWHRLELALSGTSLAVAKQIAVFLMLMLLQVYLFLVGRIAFGLGPVQSFTKLFAASFSCALILGLLSAILVATIRSLVAMQAVVNLLGLLLAGLGGVFSPAEMLPEPIASISQYTPGYWIIRVYREAFLDPAVATAPIWPLAVFIIVFAGLAFWTSSRDQDLELGYL